MKTYSPLLSYAPTILIATTTFLAVLAVPGTLILTILGTTLINTVLLFKIASKVLQSKRSEHPLLQVILAHLATLWCFGGIGLLLIKNYSELSNNTVLSGLILSALTLVIILGTSKKYLNDDHFLKVTAWGGVILLLMLIVAKVFF